jgi:hypothetical protein
MDPHPGGKKREKNKLNNKQAAELKKNKRYVQRGWGVPAPESGEGAIPHGTVNKQAATEGRNGTTSPSVLGEGKACNSGCCVESTTGEGGRATPHVNCK